MKRIINKNGILRICTVIDIFNAERFLDKKPLLV